MAELTPLDRVQPCLLDRLTDEDPGNRQESRSQRVVSLRRFREGVLRDLRWLLASHPGVDEEELERHPELKTSVINYGIRDLAGQMLEKADAGALERLVSEAILRFEPRIIPRSLKVSYLGSTAGRSQGNPLRLDFEIKGDLWAEPLPETFLARTEIDLETGECNLRI
ncbi:MAG: type VI secretion system baseplate subunit TssE [Puniceicoccaceae bacterium]|nr:MAG: type VI secretion system baseplate subunit TssE [Puniceicoccaceae bacterium]